jgi:hypothetical protein
MTSPCQCTGSAESVSLNRSTVAATLSRNRITGPGTAPLYPIVLMVWSLAISTSAGPMRSVTSASPSGPARFAAAMAAGQQKARADRDAGKKTAARMLTTFLV